MPKARHTPTASKWVAVATVLAATPALAAAPSGRELADWLARNDLPAAQVAIVAPEYVYSLQAGSRLPNGDVMALVRTEVRDADWGAAHGFQSWEADLLFDCQGGRVRTLKSAVYPKPNRKGDPTMEPVDGDWFAPKSSQPAAQLLSAACDPAFAWPLRPRIVAAAPARLADAAPVETKPVAVASAAPAVTVATAAPIAPPPAKLVLQTPPAEPKPEPKPTLIAAAPPVSPPPSIDATKSAPPPAPERPRGQYVIQIVYSSSETGARNSLLTARTTLGPMAAGLSDVMQTTEFGRHKRPRHTGYLSGFADASAALKACDVLRKAGQGCVPRPAVPQPPPTPASSPGIPSATQR